MNKIYFLLLIVSFTFSSCFIADGYFLEDKKSTPNLDLKVEKEISKYIKNNSENYTYKNYGFSELIIKKPKALIQLDNLKKHFAKDTTRIDLKEKINKLENQIKTQNIRYTLQMDHIYALTHIKNTSSTESLGKTELFETQFTLEDSISVSELKPLLLLSLTSQEAIIFEDYFYEKPIFSNSSYENNRNLSLNLYDFLKSKQNQLTGIKNKSSFLKHSLELCNEIKEDGYFDQTYFVTKLADRRLRQDTTIKQYKSIAYTDLFEIKKDEKLVNYYFFHSFIEIKNNLLDTSAVYIEFSPHYELTDISRLKKPFNTYFND